MSPKHVSSPSPSGNDYSGFQLRKERRAQALNAGVPEPAVPVDVPVVMRPLVPSVKPSRRVLPKKPVKQKVQFSALRTRGKSR